MGTIPPDSVGGRPGIPEHNEPSGPVGDFALGSLDRKQKGQLEQMTGQLSIMSHLSTYNAIVFQNLKTFLGGLENQTPPLKESMLAKVKEANALVDKALDNPDAWKETAPQLQRLLHELI